MLWQDIVLGYVAVDFHTKHRTYGQYSCDPDQSDHLVLFNLLVSLVIFAGGEPLLLVLLIA